MNWQDAITEAADRIAGHVRETPVMMADSLGLNEPVALKLEHLQHTGSFKARGAFNTLLAGPVPDAGLVAASGGNHGAAVAFAAQTLGHPAHIFVPEMAGPAKIALIRETGAALTVVPGAYSDALFAAETFERKTGAIQIHAYDAVPTLVGQGTCMREWEAQGLDADTILIAVGGGGLIGGALAWLQGRLKVVAVEPETACALHAALNARARVDVEVSGVAVNSLGAKRIGQLCFDLAQGITSVTVSDDAILAAQSLLWRRMRLLVEPGGATALAALTSGAYVPEPGERVAVLLCGGNVAPDPLPNPVV